MFAATAIVAIAVGTFARGFFGQDWYFNADNVADSLPLALPFLVAAGVMLGVDRWSPGRTWFVIGAWLLALHGVLDVLLELQFASIMSDGTAGVPSPWPAAQSWLHRAAQALGFGALAVGMWLAPADGWRGLPRWGALVIAIATVLTVAGLVYVNLAALVATHALTPEWVLIVVLGGLFVVAAAAFAVACLRAAPRGMPLPELVIANRGRGLRAQPWARLVAVRDRASRQRTRVADGLVRRQRRPARHGLRVRQRSPRPDIRGRSGQRVGAIRSRYQRPLAFSVRCCVS